MASEMAASRPVGRVLVAPDRLPLGEHLGLELADPLEPLPLGAFPGGAISCS
jgi:hypothetical protein